jgi:DNA-binding NarL/FixJ family response regulator
MVISVLVVDAERVFADAVAAQLDTEPSIAVVAAVSPCSQGAFVPSSRPADIVLVDADLTDGTSNSLCGRLTRCGSRVIMISYSSDPARIVSAVRAGAAAWVCKDESVDYLLRVVRGVARGETWLPPAAAGTVLQMLIQVRDRQEEADVLLDALTPRERQVLDCLAEGVGRREVALRLCLSANTVRTHTQNLMAKLGVHSTLEAVAMLRRHATPDEDGRGLADATSISQMSQ